MVEAKTTSMQLGLLINTSGPVEVKGYFIVSGCGISLHPHLLTCDKNRNTHGWILLLPALISDFSLFIIFTSVLLLICQQNASILTHTQIKAEMRLLYAPFAAAARFDLKPFIFFFYPMMQISFSLSHCKLLPSN